MRFPCQVPALSVAVLIVLTAIVYVLFGCSEPTEPIPSPEQSEEFVLPQPDTLRINNLEQIKYSRAGYSITFDVSEHESDEFVKPLAIQFFVAYPQMIERFNPNPYRDVVVIFTKHLLVPGGSGAFAIALSSRWLKQNPNDLDVFTHELFHIVQAYPGWSNEQQWIVEGLADYARYKYGRYDQIIGTWRLGSYSPQDHYTNGYIPTARFFLWLEQRKFSLVNLNSALRSRIYSPVFWQNETKKDIEELWEEYVQSCLN